MAPLGRRGQVVRQRFAKPSFVGSNPTVASSVGSSGETTKKDLIRGKSLERAFKRSAEGTCFADPPPAPLPNYSLSSVCPACASETYRLACKVRCPNCGFMWDCSEL